MKEESDLPEGVPGQKESAENRKLEKTWIKNKKGPGKWTEEGTAAKPVQQPDTSGPVGPRGENLCLWANKRAGPKEAERCSPKGTPGPT